MNPKTDSGAASPAAAKKPHLSLFIATACGLGYLPKAPGTFGSLAGLAITALSMWPWVFARTPSNLTSKEHIVRLAFGILLYQLILAAAIAFPGVWAADRVAAYHGQKDPQFVVIDEVSGQQLALVLGFGCVNWKYLALGFILFRAFDIWKPFPARQAESLPGGWGIMADDWVAAVYAALGLWIARAAGL